MTGKDLIKILDIEAKQALYREDGSGIIISPNFRVFCLIREVMLFSQIKKNIMPILICK